MDPFDIAQKLTLTAGLVAVIVAFFLGLVVTRAAVVAMLAEREARHAAVIAERDKREALLVAERDMWRSVAETAQGQRDAADHRTERLTAAFEIAYRILAGGARAGGVPALEPPDPPAT